LIDAGAPIGRCAVPETVRWRGELAEATVHGPITVVPESRALVVRLPFGGLVWNRPIAVRVTRDGETTRLALRDVTRTAQVALFALGLAALVVPLVAGNRGAANREKEPD
jgi:hypothetical protein